MACLLKCSSSRELACCDAERRLWETVIDPPSPEQSLMKGFRHCWHWRTAPIQGKESRKKLYDSVIYRLQGEDLVSWACRCMRSPRSALCAVPESPRFGTSCLDSCYSGFIQQRNLWESEPYCMATETRPVQSAKYRLLCQYHPRLCASK